MLSCKRQERQRKYILVVNLSQLVQITHNQLPWYSVYEQGQNNIGTDYENLKRRIKGICVSLNRSAEEYDPQKTIHFIVVAWSNFGLSCYFIDFYFFCNWTYL